MKKLVTSYTFDASAKTIDAADFTALEKIQLITNVTDNIIIYNFADPAKGGTLSGTTLTLTYDTTGMADADKIQIFIDDSATTTPVSGTVTANLGTLNGAATSAKQDTGNTSLSSIDTKIDAITTPSDTQPVSAASLPLPSGAATVANQQTDALTNTQLRASAVPISASSLPLPSGAATSAKQDTGNTSVASIDTKIPALGQALSAASTPVVLPAAQITTLTPPAAITGFATATKQDTGNTSLSSIDTKLTDNATQTTLATRLSESDFDTKTGSLTETAPGTDTASSGLNGRLQRIAQRITTFIAQLPSSLGQKTKANSLAVTLASDQDALPITDNAGSLTVDGTVAATQSGTWTVQPGNTANTTAWKVDGSAVTQPVSGTVTANAGTNLNTSALATSAKQDTLLTELQAKADLTETQPVSLASVPSHAVTNAGTFAVQATVAAALPAGSNNIGDVDVLSLPALPAGTNVVGKVSIDQTTPGTTNLVALAANQSVNLAQVAGATVQAGNGVSSGAQRVTISNDSTGQVAVAASATATGAAVNSQTALTNTKISVKTSAGNLYGYHIYNPNTVVTYVQIFNLLTASVTLGTTTPTMVLAIPAGGWADSPTTAPGIAFGTGIVIAATTTSTGSSAPATALLSNFWYL